MKKILVILALLLTLPFGDGVGVGYAHTSFFEVQVPMTNQQGFSSKPSTPLTVGHFATTVQPLDERGFAYTPGSGTSGDSYHPGRPRKVSGEDEDDERETEDPYFDKVAPVGNIPWFFLALLLAAYLIPRAIKLHRISRYR